jgi:flagellar hook-associated protein 2
MKDLPWWQIMNLGISGLASGFDWQSLISQLAEVERAPQRTMLSEQTKIEGRSQAFGAIKTNLDILKAKVQALKDPALFDSRTTSSSDSDLGTATASAGATVGQYKFNITQLATASRQLGTAGAGSALGTTPDLSGITVGDAPFANTITAGTFTVNGKQISIESTDSLASVFTKISDATGGDVTASYDPNTDKISLSSASSIVLGTVTDTSNFLQAARLTSNNQSTITSDGELGAIRLNSTLDEANFGTAITGGSAGEFKINGVTIQYDTSTDTVGDLLSRINASAAGVVAGYDATQDRFTLTNNSTGNTGIALEDGAGSNFLAATGLLGGTLDLGKNLQYNVNGGSTLSSLSNTINESSSGLTGLSVTALAQDTFTINVGTDTEGIRSAITDFVSAYNSSQSQIASLTASSTDAKGAVKAGILADDPEAGALASQLRSLATSTISGLNGTVIRLESLGISSNGYDDALSTANLDNLDTALEGNLAGLKDFFSNEDLGFAVSFDSLLDRFIGDEGTLLAHQTTLNNQAQAITPQIDAQEKWVLGEIERLTANFVAMEAAQARNNQQLQYLTKTFS